MGDVVVRQRAVEWILTGNKSYGDIIASRRRVGGIEATVIARPIRVPGTPVVRHRIVASGFFSDPKDRRHNIRFPRKTLYRGARARWNKNLRLHFKQGLLPQPHRIFGKIRRRRVGRRGLFVGLGRADHCQTETGRQESLHLKFAATSYPITRPDARQIFRRNSRQRLR
jgi:hypothetical protein